MAPQDPPGTDAEWAEATARNPHWSHAEDGDED